MFGDTFSSACLESGLTGVSLNGSGTAAGTRNEAEGTNSQSAAADVKSKAFGLVVASHVRPGGSWTR